MDEREGKHRPCCEGVKDDELLVADTGQSGDRVGLGGEQDEEGDAGEGHPAAPRGQRRGVAEVDLCGVGPVVGLRDHGHEEEEQEAEPEQEHDTDGGRLVAEGLDLIAAVGGEADQGDEFLPPRLDPQPGGCVFESPESCGARGDDGEKEVDGSSAVDEIGYIPATRRRWWSGWFALAHIGWNTSYGSGLTSCDTSRGGKRIAHLSAYTSSPARSRAW